MFIKRSKPKISVGIDISLTSFLTPDNCKFKFLNLTQGSQRQVELTIFRSLVVISCKLYLKNTKKPGFLK